MAESFAPHPPAIQDWMDRQPQPDYSEFMPKREWVCGFLFDRLAQKVVLIRKNRPEWQKGMLNGVGGKVEDSDRQAEDPLYFAMAREFHEEAGVLVHPTAWRQFLTLHWEQGIVHFFRAFDDDACATAHTTTDEGIERHWVYRLNEPGPGLANVTPNLLWLIPLAAHRHDTYELITVVETDTTLRKVGRASHSSDERDHSAEWTRDFDGIEPGAW